MSKFKPFDYLTKEEQKEVIRYETLIYAARNVTEYLDVECIIDEYRKLGIARRCLEDLNNTLESDIGGNNMKESFRHYQVIETEGMSAEQLQEVLKNATNDYPEKQIEYVVGTKIILGYESILNAKGRAEAMFQSSLETSSNAMSSNNSVY